MLRHRHRNAIESKKISSLPAALNACMHACKRARIAILRSNDTKQRQGGKTLYMTVQASISQSSWPALALLSNAHTPHRTVPFQGFIVFINSSLDRFVVLTLSGLLHLLGELTQELCMLICQNIKLLKSFAWCCLLRDHSI